MLQNIEEHLIEVYRTWSTSNAYMWEVKQTKPLKKVNLYTKDNAQYLISIIQISFY